MSRLIVFEDHGLYNLKPLVLWRTVFELRVGRKILLDRIAQAFQQSIAGIWTRSHIANVAGQRCGAPVNEPAADGDVLVNGRWVPVGAIEPMPKPCAAYVGDKLTYIHCDHSIAERFNTEIMLDAQHLTSALQDIPRVDVAGWHVDWPWDLITRNTQMLHQDFRTGNAVIESDVDDGIIDGPLEMIHVGPGTQIHRTSSINADSGPIFIGEGVRIGPYCVIEGPAYIGPKSVINPHTWLHGGNSIGPVCKIGGEVDGCVIHGYTNKQHAGFLGHSYVGSWVNLGAGTTNSDLKNTYGNVRMMMHDQAVDSGTAFMGAIIGDHVKTGIQTTIPTGSIIGSGSVVFSSAIIPNDVKPFTWLTDNGKQDGDPKRLVAVARTAMARRDITMTDADCELFLHMNDAS